MISDIEPCPTCGALPCDWVNDPHTATLHPSPEDPIGGQDVETLTLLLRRALAYLPSTLGITQDIRKALPNE